MAFIWITVVVVVLALPAAAPATPAAGSNGKALPSTTA
jgi:hypothetical protein